MPSLFPLLSFSHVIFSFYHYLLLLLRLPPPPPDSPTHSTFKALLVFLAVPTIGMLLQSRSLRGALKVLKADFALDRLGCGVLYWYHYTIQSVSASPTSRDCLLLLLLLLLS